MFSSWNLQQRRTERSLSLIFWRVHVQSTHGARSQVTHRSGDYSRRQRDPASSYRQGRLGLVLEGADNARRSQLRYSEGTYRKKSQRVFIVCGLKSPLLHQ